MELPEDTKENIEKKIPKINIDKNKKKNNYYKSIEHNKEFLGRKRELENKKIIELNKYNNTMNKKSLYTLNYNNNSYKQLKNNNYNLNNEYYKDIKTRHNDNNTKNHNSYSKNKRDNIIKINNDNNYRKNYNKNERVNNDIKEIRIIKEEKEINKNPIYIGDYIYKEEHQIGTGSFGKVYCGMHRTKYYKVAIKIPIEKANLDMINKEVRYTKMMQKEPGFPILFNSCVFNNKHIIIESLLGPSLDKLFIYCGKSFPIKTICLIGIEIVKRLQSMHKIGLLHRDLKPNNFTWGNFSQYNNDNLLNNLNNDFDINSIFLIDFGLSDPYLDLKTRKHLKNQKGMKFVGTLRYSSINSHRGIRQCRKDDLESLMYILIYFYKGKLPWQEIKSKKKAEKHKKIKEKKMRTTAEFLCKGMPIEFERMLCYIKTLEYEEAPNYDRLINGFHKTMDSLKEWDIQENGFNFIWEKKLSVDLNKTYSVNDDESSKINENINQIFKGYPDDIKKYIENNSINGSNNLTASSSNIKSTISSLGF